MSPTIAMQTDTARATSDMLLRNASNFSGIITDLEVASRRLSSAWLGERAEDYLSRFRLINKHLEERASDLEILAERLQKEICEWENAGRFFDASSPNGLKTGFTVGASGAVTAAGVGKVLGASTQSSGDYANNYRSLTWKEKFAEKQILEERISETSKELAGYPSEEQLNNDLSNIDRQIAEWEAKKLEMQSKANNFFNKIPADFTGESASEVYQKEVERCDQVLANLREQREKCMQLQGDRSDCQNRLAELTQKQTSLEQVINDGITPDGPTPASKRNILGGCTNYVATKRNVEAFFKPGQMNANFWNENAKAAGLEVGSEPVKGSIMVFEADKGADNGIRIVDNGVATEKPMNVDNSAGHVAYVESSEKVPGGHNVTISQANTKYYSNGNYVPGVYVNQNTMTVFVPNGNNMSSFIYGK